MKWVLFLWLPSLFSLNIELFIYWQPDLKGQEIVTSSLIAPIDRALRASHGEIRSWDREFYRPWLISWKEVKTWQELKWWLGWDLPKIPAPDLCVFWGLGPHLKTRQCGKIPCRHRVLFLWEPPTVEPEGYDPSLLSHFDKVFTWDDDRVDGKKFFKFYYPVLRPKVDNIPPFEEKKFCVLFSTRLSSKHPKQLYREREKIIQFFENKPGEFDLYGRNWEKRHFRNWRGWVFDKLATLKQYKFCICYENMRDVKGYITEKIFDAFAAGSVPIYWGASNVTAYIPAECFIDRRQFQSDEELYHFLKAMTREDYDHYLACAAAFLQSDAAQCFTEDHFVKTFLSMEQEMRIRL